MLFDVKLGNVVDVPKLRERIAIRGVIFVEDKLLMVKNIHGDYKFPGGGKERGETDEETLYREVKEETGYEVDNIDGLIGITMAQSEDNFATGYFFRMNSYYYSCTINPRTKGRKSLDIYETELEFKEVLITIEDAIKGNELAMLQNEQANPWVKRETEVLKILLENKHLFIK